ncbi:MAG: carbon-nitrogen hydrolase family protein [Sphingopyxis sp.]|nr:carbon-nitrogen hydrolase family protein [Sphingopyxis sp.]
MNSVTIAVTQMTSGIDPDANLEQIASAAATAREAGAAMLFLPEMALLLDRDRTRSAAHMTIEAASPWPARLAAIAADHGLWLHSGSAPFLADDGGCRVNRSLLYSPDGGLVARYDKIHMFDVDLPGGESWRESASYAGGDRLALADTPAGRLGLTICFDLRFPELFAALVGAGATMIAVPAAFTVPTGTAHWHVLLRARAIETGCYIIAAAQGGSHADGRTTYGHSLIVDPWGKILAEGPPGSTGASTPVALTAKIDPATVAEARAAIPLTRSRAVRNIRL